MKMQLIAAWGRTLFVLCFVTTSILVAGEEAQPDFDGLSKAIVKTENPDELLKLISTGLSRCDQQPLADRCRFLLRTCDKLAHLKTTIPANEYEELRNKAAQCYFKIIASKLEVEKEHRAYEDQLNLFPLEDRTPWRNVRNKDYNDPRYLAAQEVHEKMSNTSQKLVKVDVYVGFLADCYLVAIGVTDRKWIETEMDKENLPDDVKKGILSRIPE